MARSSALRGVSALDLVRQLWAQAQLPSRVLENTIQRGNVMLINEPSGAGQAVRSSFQLTAVAQACCAAIALAERLRLALERIKASSAGEAEVERLVLDRVEVDARHAIAEYVGWTKVHIGQAGKGQMLREAVATDSEAGREVLNIDAHAVADWDALAGLYRTRPNPHRTVTGVVRIHTNFPHHKLGILQMLNLAPRTARWTDARIYEDVFAHVERADLQRELSKWDAFEFEHAAQEAGLCVTAYRSRAEWEASEMAQALRVWMGDNAAGGSAFRISHIDSPTPTARRRSTTSRPDKLRVVDMSRVIAGPISTRTLAAHGADVLLLSSARLPNLPLRELDTARGKRTAFVELPPGGSGLTEQMDALLRGADVVSQAYRPQGLAERGLSAEEVQKIRPGIVYAELCAFGFTGPWADRRAYDSLTQTACGINYLEGLSYQQHESATEVGEVEPKALPVQALDYAAGSLMCFATLACKCRAILERINDPSDDEEEMEAKGWKVQISLASTAEWIMSLGQIDGDEAWTTPPQDIIPMHDEARLAAITSSYKVRGISQQDVHVLAVRHASLPDATSEADDGLRWTVPSHLGVDRLEWL
ncbi:hypothetical protein EX895_006164 [Sporisorium graminicola]|uniref:CoA-transferase family III n=1 Tax=Sporisorium graminicola TaxID=280036 RepID=A0A4U7KLV4_9BASI|nr:hypothetical protein EX895_006164 [Sporisorium graminicola]TKY85084.1 hypothetical protein EX895_006164 [Sporisorium graminicola]